MRLQLMSQGPGSPQRAERALMVGEDHVNFKLVARIVLRRSVWGIERSQSSMELRPMWLRISTVRSQASQTCINEA